MRVYLAGIGWVPQIPAGNRLRWAYPSQALVGGKFLGFPETILVQRAPLKDEKIVPPSVDQYGSLSPAASANVPVTWWDDLGTINLTGFPPLIYKLPSPVQAGVFIYHGPAARMLVLDTEGNVVVADRILRDGDSVHLESQGMDEFIFASFAAELQNFRTLDLFKDRGLKWETIAEIGVKGTANISVIYASKRYDSPATLSATEWGELAKLANRAESSTPSDVVAGDPTPWQSFDMALGLRWEFALLYGYAFFDGPRTQTSSIDRVNTSKLLTEMPPTAYAYRVREKETRTLPSNIVVCPPWPAPALLPPGTPNYIDPEVRLNDIGNFEATLTLAWQQPDARALGVEFEQQIGSSPILGSSPVIENFMNRSRRPEDPPMEGRLARVFDVPFYDVVLTARARAIDAWDRTSVYSAYTSPTSLQLRHNPPPPTLASAVYESGQVHIVRQVGDPNFPDWHADIIVEKSAGKVFVYRKNPAVLPNPRVADVMTTAPLPVDGRLYKCTIIVPNPSDFEDGFLIAGQVKASIQKIVGVDFFFQTPDEGGNSVTLFSAGPAKLQQNPMNPSLWLKVAEFPSAGLPDELIFNDPVPGPIESSDVLSYCTRVSYLGRLGPASNIVHAIRVPVTPSTPPPFSVAILGIDFYKRTLIKTEFTNPVTEGKYSMWWADGLLDSTQFASHAVPGEYGAQTVDNQLFIYDVLSLPIPNKADRPMTIGLQRVNEGGGQSNFQTVQITLAGAP